MSDLKNRARIARENAGLTVGQACRFLGLDVDALTAAEGDNVAFAARADRHARMSEVYGVTLEWLTGTVPRRDYATVDAMYGADTLSFHDRDIVAEFAASLGRGRGVKEGGS